MPIFLGVHQGPPPGVEPPAGMPGPREGWEAYCKAAKEMGLKPLGVMVSMERRTGLCQTEADSVDEVKKAHEMAKIPLQDVYEVTIWDPA